jgi:tetratricopeptide (TPR) repeat protein
VSELHPISDICRDPARRDTRKADVVFVHGLMGDAFKTWRHGETEASSWPHWVAERYRDVGVWSVEYAALPSHWLMRDDGSEHSAPIIRRANEVMNDLAYTLGALRPLIFVCHSLGGLLAKEIIWQASYSEDAKCRSICERAFAVMFLATPHQGADMAKVVGKLSLLLRPSDNIRDLEANSPQLGKQYDWYRQQSEKAFGIRTRSFYETKKTGGVWLVDAATANPGVGPAPIHQEVDHIEISKPKSPGALVCKVLDSLIDDGMMSPPAATTSPSSKSIDKSGSSSVVEKGQGAIPCRLPDAASRFFGRESEVDALVQRLRTERNTVVSGPAGFGKTALAAEALRRLLGERPWERLREMPFPDGIVNVDLYSEKDQPRLCWKRIADVIGGVGFLGDQAEDVRAREACRGRRLLLIVEGGEEADGGPRPEGGQRPSRHALLEPLDWEGGVLWLTRPTPTSPRADIVLDAPLDGDEARKLLIHLTAGAPMPLRDAEREALLRLLDGHPLALTWAGGLLQQGGLSPSKLVEELQGQPSRAVHDPEKPQRTLHWLFERSVRLLDPAARKTLAAAGLLALAPFPAEAIAAATGLETQTQREALRKCAQSRLLIPVDDDAQSDHWRFGHALGYQFARALGLDDDQAGRDAMLEGLMVWVDARLSAELKANALARSLPHIEALSQAVRPPQGWQPLFGSLLYTHEDRLDELGRLGERFTVIGLVERWWQGLPDAMKSEAHWQREAASIHELVGLVLQVQGDLAGAQRRYEAGLRIREALAARDPENAGWQRDLSVSENKLGDVLQVQGDLAGAQRRYEAGLRIREALAARDPENAGWQRDLMVGFFKLGTVCQAQREIVSCRAHWSEARSILQTLVDRWPEHPQFRRDLAAIDHALALLKN